MVAKISKAERLLILETADRYRELGFEVTSDCPLEFLPEFHADLVARKGDFSKVIEVKSRSSLASSPMIVKAAEIIESKPNWGFEFVFVPESETLEGPDGSSSIGEAGIASRIDEAKSILKAGHPEAALLVAWSATEAAARRLIAEEVAADFRITTASFVLEQATYLGVISRDEYQRLTEIQKYRNAIAHGIGHGAKLEPLVTELIGVAGELISSVES